MTAPPSQQSPVPYGVLETDMPHPIEAGGCSRCGRQLDPDGGAAVLDLARRLAWFYCGVCAGPAGYDRSVS